MAEDYPRTLVELERRFSDDAACRQYPHWGATESGGATGRLIYSKVLIVVAAEEDGKGVGRIRMDESPISTGRRFMASFDRLGNPGVRFALTGSTPTVR